MKRELVKIMLCIFLVMVVIIPLAFADVSLTTKFDQTEHYGIVASGVGLKGKTSGTISIDVPGTVVAAYLYWAGYDIETGGDDSVQFDGVAVTADQSYVGEWFGYFYHFVYVKDLTALALVNTGPDNYEVSDLTLGVANYGAGLLVVYEDVSLPTARVVVMDGLDGFFFDWDPDLGPNSEVACFEFTGVASDRDVEMFLLVGGTEHEDRPNEVWTETGTGTPETNIVDPPSSPTDPPDYPLYAADGPSWDTYTADVLIPAGDEWLCVQIESIESWETGPHYAGRGTSALFIAAGFVLPVEYEMLDGLSPGFWKHNVRVALGYPGGYSVPHEGEPRMDLETITALAEDATGQTGNDALNAALAALTAKGPGSATIRLDMANAFNAAAGYTPYED